MSEAFLNRIINVSGGGAVVEKDINFYDYDGLLVASYDLSELPLASLPTPPAHTGLTFDGWNWSLTDINALSGKMNIGAMYKTTSGDTELDVTLTTVTGLTLPLNVFKTDAGTMTIDWGDSSTDTSTSTGQQAFSHTYANVGNYTIKIQFTGAYYLKNSTNGNILVAAANNINYSLTAIRLSEYVTSLGNYCFYNCYSLTSITIPSSLTSIGDACFRNCYILTSITIPSSLTSIRIDCFYNCYSLTSITIPSSLTRIGDRCFSNCYSLTSITIPSSLTSIRFDCFYNCYSLIKYIFNSATPPTLASTNAFTGINAICKMEVPVGSLSTYQTATNWSTYADYMEEQV